MHIAPFAPGARQADAWLVLRPVDDERHAQAFKAFLVVEGQQLDIAAAMRLAAFIDLLERARRVLQVKHRGTPHFPIGVARMRIIRVLDRNGPSVFQGVGALHADFVVGELRQERKLSLGDFHLRNFLVNCDHAKPEFYFGKAT